LPFRKIIIIRTGADVEEKEFNFILSADNDIFLKRGNVSHFFCNLFFSMFIGIN